MEQAAAGPCLCGWTGSMAREELMNPFCTCHAVKLEMLTKKCALLHPSLIQSLKVAAFSSARWPCGTWQISGGASKWTGSMKLLTCGCSALSTDVTWLKEKQGKKCVAPPLGPGVKLWLMRRWRFVLQQSLFCILFRQCACDFGRCSVCGFDSQPSGLSL